MFCHKCGKEIDDDAVVCIHCGAETKNMKKDQDKPINIVNQSSSSSNSQNDHQPIPIVYNGFVDFIMTVCTCGLWIIWMLTRPKYR